MKATDIAEYPTRMNPTDALFWSMDKLPDMRSTMGGFVVLERAPSREHVHSEFERLATDLPRMRQRVVEVPFALAPPEWVEDPQFDLDYHLRFLAVPEPGGLPEVLEEIGPLYATAFDRDRPLWEAYVIEGLRDGRGAIFIKMHHCMTDGVGGSRLTEALLSKERHIHAPAGPPAEQTRSTTPGALLWRAMLYNVEDAVKTGSTLVRNVVSAATSPAGLVRELQQGLSSLSGFKQELSAPRAHSPLHAQRSLSRRLSTFEMSVPDIDAVRGELDATNNDIVLTVVSGAMHRWHTSRGDDTQELRALVPVNLRGTSDRRAGNNLAMLAVTLPIGEPNPLRRLRIIQRRMGKVKVDRRATLYPVLARVMTALPLVLAERISRQQTTRTNFACTNVPGPRETVYLAGEVVERIYPYAPLVGDHPVSIALLSYRDTMCVGLDIDPLAMDDLEHFRDALREAYEEVLNVGKRPTARTQPRVRRNEPSDRPPATP